MKSIISFVAMLIAMLALDFSLTGGDLLLQVYLKGLASVLFVLTGIFALCERPKIRGRTGSYACFILLGLLFGFVGDVSMQLADIKGDLCFIIGLVTFALGHIFYLAAFFKKSHFRWFNLLPTLTVIPLFLFAIPASGQFEFNPSFLFFAVIAYGVILTFMVGKSLSFTEFKGQPAFVRMTIAGAILFAISDIILLFILFFKPVIALSQFDPVRLTLRFAGLLTYYPGQGLIALSLKKEP